MKIVRPVRGIIAVMLVFTPSALLALVRSAEEQAMHLAAIVELMENAPNLPKHERIQRLGHAIWQLSQPSIFEDRVAAESIYSDAQRQLLGIPGHAEHYRDRILDLKEKVLAERPVGLAGTQYSRYCITAFQTLAHLPSLETVGVLTELLDDEEVLGDTCLAIRSGQALHKLLADPPTDNSMRWDLWQQWRDEIRAGQSTFRFKGSEVRYNFAGPVAARGERERKEGAGESGEEGSRAEKDDAGAGRDGEGRAVWPILLAGGAFIGALVVWLVRRGR